MIHIRLFQLYHNGTELAIKDGTEVTNPKVISVSELQESLEIEDNVFRLDNISLVLSGLEESFFANYTDLVNEPFVVVIKEGGSWAASDLLFHGVIDPDSINYNHTTKRTSFDVLSWDYILGTYDSLPARSVYETSFATAIRTEGYLKETREHGKADIFFKPGDDPYQIFQPGSVAVYETEKGEFRSIIHGIEQVTTHPNESYATVTLSGLPSPVTHDRPDAYIVKYNLHGVNVFAVLVFDRAFRERALEQKGNYLQLLNEAGKVIVGGVIKEVYVTGNRRYYSQAIGHGTAYLDGNQDDGAMFILDVPYFNLPSSINTAQPQRFKIYNDNIVTKDTDVTILGRELYGLPPISKHGAIEFIPDPNLGYDASETAHALLSLEELGILRHVVNSLEAPQNDVLLPPGVELPDNPLDALRAIQRTNGSYLRLIPTLTNGLPSLTVQIIKRNDLASAPAVAASRIRSITNKTVEKNPVSAVVVRVEEEISKPSDHPDEVIGFYYDGIEQEIATFSSRQRKGVPQGEGVVEIKVVSEPAYRPFEDEAGNLAIYYGDGEYVFNDAILYKIAEGYYRFFNDTTKNYEIELADLYSGSLSLLGKRVTFNEGGIHRTIFVTETVLDLKEGTTKLVGREGELEPVKFSRPKAIITGLNHFIDSDDNGLFYLQLGATESFDPLRGALQYEWTVQGNSAGLPMGMVLGASQLLSYTLPVGMYTIQLKVTSESGGVDYDSIVLTLGDTIDWLNLPPDFVFPEFHIRSWQDGSRGVLELRIMHNEFVEGDVEYVSTHRANIPKNAWDDEDAISVAMNYDEALAEGVIESDEIDPYANNLYYIVFELEDTKPTVTEWRCKVIDPFKYVYGWHRFDFDAKPEFLNVALDVDDEGHVIAWWTGDEDVTGPTIEYYNETDPDTVFSKLVDGQSGSTQLGTILPGETLVVTFIPRQDDPQDPAATIYGDAITISITNANDRDTRPDLHSTQLYVEADNDLVATWSGDDDVSGVYLSFSLDGSVPDDPDAESHDIAETGQAGSVTLGKLLRDNKAVVKFRAFSATELGPVIRLELVNVVDANKVPTLLDASLDLDPIRELFLTWSGDDDVAGVVYITSSQEIDPATLPTLTDNPTAGRVGSVNLGTVNEGTTRFVKIRPYNADMELGDSIYLRLSHELSKVFLSVDHAPVVEFVQILPPFTKRIPVIRPRERYLITVRGEVSNAVLKYATTINDPNPPDPGHFVTLEAGQLPFVNVELEQQCSTADATRRVFFVVTSPDGADYYTEVQSHVVPSFAGASVPKLQVTPVQPYFGGGRLNFTLSDPGDRATEYGIRLYDAETGWGEYEWNPIPAEKTWFTTVNLHPNHNTIVGWAIRYVTNDGEEAVDEGFHTFDTDRKPNVIYDVSLSFDATAKRYRVYLAWKGDEDTHGIVYTVNGGEEQATAGATGKIAVASLNPGEEVTLTARGYIRFAGVLYYEENVFEQTVSASVAVGDASLLVNVPADKIVGVLPVTSLVKGAQRFSTDITFKATSGVSVSWTSGTVTLQDGVDYPLPAGSVNLTGLGVNYLYLDTTAPAGIMATTDVAILRNPNAVVLCTCQRGETGNATVVPVVGTWKLGSENFQAASITANHLAANSVQAQHIDVTSLQAIKAETGSLTVTGTLLMGVGGAITNAGGDYLIDDAGINLTPGSGDANAISWDGSAAIVHTGSYLNIASAVGGVKISGASIVLDDYTGVNGNLDITGNVHATGAGKFAGGVDIPFSTSPGSPGSGFARLSFSSINESVVVNSAAGSAVLATQTWVNNNFPSASAIPSVHSTAGAPSSNLGKPGDFAFTAFGSIYIKNPNNVWVQIK